MPKPAAKAKDTIFATDTHLLNGSPMELPFLGIIDGDLSPNVLVEKKYAAMVGTTATNTPVHLAPPGKTFDKPPSNQGVIVGGSGTVLINNRQAARDGDQAKTCNDPKDLPAGLVVAKSTVIIGG
ncbi:MAG: PAAR domain-containing protein [Byssovorax sp.]